MPQLRYWDYGSDVDQFSDNFVQYALNTPGVYSGLDLGVDTLSQLTLGTGWGLQPDGVVWQEDTPLSFIFTPPGVVSTYTLVATHVDQSRFGVVAVEYELQSGELTSVANGVVLGWIYHPGGGVPLDASMLLSSPKRMPDSYTAAVVNSKPLELVPAYPRSYHDVVSSGFDTALDPILWETVDQFLIYQQARNSATAPGAEAVVQHLQLYADEIRRPRNVEIYCNIPAGPFNNLTVQIYDTAQVLLASQIFLSTTNWETISMDVPRSGGTFDSGKPYTIRLVFNLGVGQNIRTGRVKMNFWPYPII